MRPPPDQALVAAAMALAGASDSITDAYQATTVQVVAGMCFLLSQDHDRGAARRVAEIDATASLLRRGADLPGLDPELAGRLRAACAEADRAAGDLTMHGLDQRLDGLRRALIELHAALEERSDPAAAELLERVWDELRASVERRAVDLPLDL